MFTGKSLFESENRQPQNLLDLIKNCEIVFVADMFANQYVGGAELTTEALFQASDRVVCKIKSSDLNSKLLEAGLKKHWVFFNYSGMNFDLIPQIIANLNYSIVEYDYKFCKYRSVEKHKIAEDSDCDCHQQVNGKIVSAFKYAAEKLFWMSEKQRNLYFELFPFLKTKDNFVLSSVFTENTLDFLRQLRNQYKDNKNEKWIVIGSSSWIKGAIEAENYCKSNDLDYEIVWGLSHKAMLEKLAQSKGHVYLPPGGDTCPRAVIEAKLAGCELVLNDNVQHDSEEWFSEDIEDIDKYLRDSASRFWKVINDHIDRSPTISGYTTTKDCISQDYPFETCIQSMLGFCDQVVVVDGGSTDGTWERLEKIALEDDRIVISKKSRDWNHKRFAVFDGLQKAYARSLCAGEWCWQMDSDEIVHESDYKKIKNLIKEIPKSIHLLSLPVIEYWGGSEKVRIDVNPWKWRLSRNHPHITHGIPKKLRMTDKDGNLYALPGTDGCDYIDSESYEVIPCMHFYNNEIHNIRSLALSGNEDAVIAYENWFNNLVENLPGVHHYSWYNLERKIKTYRSYWSKHWQSLYDIKQDDTAENNMFFDKPWSDVKDAEITALAEKLKDKMGGWVFHEKVDFNKPTPHIYIERGEPKGMKNG